MVNIQNKGIQVICIAGDLSFKTKYFEYKTEDGIQYLASGMNMNEDKNDVIIFEHNIELNQLSWSRRLLNSF